MKKRLASLLFVFVTHLASADTCLPLSALKSNDLQGWMAYSANEGDLLSETQLQQYENQVTHFSIATWLEDAPEGEAQCYYSNARSPDFLGVYLAKHGLTPDAHAPWLKSGPYSKTCQVSLGGCVYRKK